MIKEDNEEKEPTFSQKVVPWIVASFVLFLVLLTKVFIDTLLGLRFGGGAILQSLFTTVCIGLWCIIFYCPFFKINKTRKRQNKFETSVKLSALPVVFFVIFFMAVVTDDGRNDSVELINKYEGANNNFDSKNNKYDDRFLKIKTYTINNPNIEDADKVMEKNSTRKREKFWISYFENEDSFSMYTAAISDDKKYSAIFMIFAGSPCLFIMLGEYIDRGVYDGEIIIGGDIFRVKIQKDDDTSSFFSIVIDEFETMKQLYILMARGNSMKVNIFAGNTTICTTFSLHGFTATLKRIINFMKK